jgi:hypothetical protein
MFLHFFKDSAVSLKPPKPLPRSHWNRRSRFRGLIDTKESTSAVSLKPRKQLPQSHLGRWRRQFQTIISWRFQSRMWNGFSPWIRALGGLIDEKNRGSKISWHCPFKLKCLLVLNLKILYLKMFSDWHDWKLFRYKTLSAFMSQYVILGITIFTHLILNDNLKLLYNEVFSAHWIELAL